MRNVDGKVTLGEIRRDVLAALVAAGAGLPAWTQSEDDGRTSGIFREGQAVPALELPTIDRRATIDLASLAGKKAIVLQFASW